MKRRMVLVLLAVLLAAEAGNAASAYVQAENFIASYDIAYVPIRAYIGLLQGLDYPGEWAEYRLPDLPYGTYQVAMRCWGDPVPYVLRLLTFPAQGGDPQTIEFTFQGAGSDCA